MHGFPNEGSQTCFRVEIVFARLSASFSTYSFKGTVITCLITKDAACTHVCTDFISNNQTMICLKGRLCKVFRGAVSSHPLTEQRLEFDSLTRHFYLTAVLLL